MFYDVCRDDAYLDRLRAHIAEKYGIRAAAITPAKRGYYGETWKLQTQDGVYFVKLDTLAHHQARFQNSLPVMDYLCGQEKNYIVDWDEVMHAPLERDAWVMCCRGWARELFNQTLRENNIDYQLRPERLAYYCYHMYFFYLGEFLACLPFRDMSGRIKDYLDNCWIRERVLFADTI